MNAKHKWESWTVKQRYHFLFDHKDKFASGIKISDASDYDYEQLPESIKKVLEKHLNMPAYKRGATIEQKEKVGKVMREYKRGKLKTGSGKKVASKKQAVAIALSEAGLSKKSNKTSKRRTTIKRKVQKLNNGGNIEKFKPEDEIRFKYGRPDEQEIKTGTVTEVLKDGYAVSSGLKQIKVDFEDVIGLAEKKKNKSPFSFFEKGGNISSEADIEFICGCLNRYGDGKHPRATPQNLNDFSFEYIKETICKTKEDHLTEQGKNTFKALKEGLSC